MKLRIKLLISQLILSLIPVIVIACYANFFLKTEKFESMYHSYIGQLKQVDFGISTYLKEVEYDILGLASHPFVTNRDDARFTNFLHADENTFEYNYTKEEQDIIDLFANYRKSHIYANSVYMGRENGAFVRSHPRARPTKYDPRQRSWYKKAMETPVLVTRTAPYKSVTTDDINIGFVKALYSDNFEIYGVVGLDITLNLLTREINRIEIEDCNYLMVIDDNGIILTNPDFNKQYSHIKDAGYVDYQKIMSNDDGYFEFTENEKDYYGFFYTSPELQWKICAAIPAEHINSELNAVLYAIGLVLIISLILSSIDNYFTAGRITKPINVIMSYIDKLTGNHWDIDAIPVTNADETGRLAQAINMMQERLKSSFDKIRNQNEKLMELDKMKDDFLANTSHELRTPLNGIIGIAESMLDTAGQSLDAKQKHNLSLVVSSGRRLANLVNDILDFSKLKSGDIAVASKPVDMHVLTDIVISLIQPQIFHKNLTIVNEIDPDMPPASGDESRLEQIMMNLVGNAVKFTGNGTVTISSIWKKDIIEISVKDTGIGIPLEKQKTIFDSFEQVDASITRKYGGTGLGLSITKKLVELQGGTIRVESEKGKGSTFTFSIPVSHKKAAKKEDQKALVSLRDDILTEYEKNYREQATTAGKFTILVVDDEPINHEVLSSHLSYNNYSIIQAFSGQEALDVLDNGRRIDMVLLDIMMPQMSGYEVCQLIREKYLPSQLPIIMVTAKDRVNDLVEGFAAGANDYLAKPFSKSELLSRIKTHLHLLRINSAYGRFVPHEFLKTLGRESILDVELGDQFQGKTNILFTDIRSFTSISEELTPKQNFDFLNDYLANLITPIRENGGFIDKYIGDAVMAIFPSDADNAMRAAIGIMTNLHKFNQDRIARLQYPIYTGISIHTGVVMMGTIGDCERMDGTVISDAVNLASRLEGLTSKFGVSIIISEETKNELVSLDIYHYRFLGKVQVKGKEQVVKIYEIYDGQDQVVIDFKNRTRPDFEKGLEFYLARDFHKGAARFRNVLNIYPEDKAAGRYLQRCEKYILEGVNSAWDGTIKLAFK